MANMTFKASLLPSSDLGYSLGSNDINNLKRWNIYGKVRSQGISSAWNKGRDNAIIATTTLNGYTPIVSTKTNNGSWDIGAYNNTSYTDDLIFTYITDTDYTNDNKTTAQIKFLENGHIVGALDGNATTATKATQDGSGNIITSKYVTLDTAQTITGTKSWGISGAGGQLNSAATDGGVNSIRIGNDVWLGDCNVAGVMGMRPVTSTITVCGFQLQDGSGNLLSKIYATSNNALDFTANQPYLRFFPTNVNLKTGTVPSSAVNFDRLEWKDYNGTTLGGLGPRWLADGREGVEMYQSRTVNGSTVYNGIGFYIDAAGKRTIMPSGPVSDWQSTFNIFPYYELTSGADCNNMPKGIYSCKCSITNAPLTNHGVIIAFNFVGTPFQMYLADNINYIYKRWYTSGAWTAWTIMGAAWS